MSTTQLSYFHQVGKEPLSTLTIGLLLEGSAKKYAERTAIISIHQNKQLTFSELLERSDQLAAGLSKLNLQKGDRLGMWGPNSIEWIALEMESCIKKVEMKALICAHKHKEQNYYNLLKAIAPEVLNCTAGKLESCRVPTLEIVVVVTEEDLKGVFKFREVLDFADSSSIAHIKTQQSLIQMDDGCNIQFTSGTTAQPKASLLSHFNLVNNSYQMGRENEFNGKHHRVCLQVPLFHVFGTNIGMLSALHYGVTIVLPSESYSPQKSFEAIVKEQCTCIFGTPTMFVDLINCQKNRKENIKLEIAVSGGAPASPHLFREIKEVLKIKTIKSVYGLTETTGACFQSLPQEGDAKALLTVGCLKDHLEAKVIDENGCMVPMGSIGELCIRGYSTFLGYWNDQAKTNEMIGIDRWLRTGDQFILLEDGYGEIKGRYKEMINRGGEKIYPKEIEDILGTHPDVLDVQVIGLPHERLGEEVCACLRVRKDAIVTLETVVGFCKGKISFFKIPSQVRIMNDFPKTTSGKIQKMKLVEQFKNVLS